MNSLDENNLDRIAVIGLGYVGLPLAMLFVNKGFYVYGIDKDLDKIDKLRQGKSYLSDLADNQVQTLIDSGRFFGTDDYQTIEKVKAVILCVPTPLRDHRHPDLSYLQSAVQHLVPYMRRGQLFVLESTTFPGTTEEVLLPLLNQNKKWKVGEDFYVGYSPERIDPGNKAFALDEIPKVISGVTDMCRQKVMDLYGKAFRTLVPVSSPKVAEMTKILENCQRFVNISFINEMAILCHKMKINIWDVIEAAKTKPYGFIPYYPGPGVGGHCIPVDPLYLLWKAKQYHTDLQFITLAKQVNDGMPAYIIERLNQLLDMPLSHARLLAVGLTYKKDVNDLRESMPLMIFEQLAKLTPYLDYHDPYQDQVHVDGKVYRSKPIDESLKQYDCVLILTDHSAIDYQRLVKHAPLIFDTRGVIKGSYNHVETL